MQNLKENFLLFVFIFFVFVFKVFLVFGNMNRNRIRIEEKKNLGNHNPNKSEI